MSLSDGCRLLLVKRLSGQRPLQPAAHCCIPPGCPEQCTRLRASTPAIRKEPLVGWPAQHACALPRLMRWIGIQPRASTSSRGSIPRRQDCTSYGRLGVDAPLRSTLADSQVDMRICGAPSGEATDSASSDTSHSPAAPCKPQCQFVWQPGPFRCTPGEPHDTSADMTGAWGAARLRPRVYMACFD